MSKIPAAVNIRLRADDHQPEHSTGACVVTPCVGGIREGGADRHYQVVNPPECRVSNNWHGWGAEDNIDQEERLDSGGLCFSSWVWWW